MSEEKNPGTSGMQAFGQEMLDLGMRCLNAGTQWLNHRRNDMANEYEHRGNRQQDHNQSRYGDGRNGRLQGGAGGRYHGTDYEDPRSEFEQAQGAGRGGQWDSSAYAEQRYGPDYSESGGSRGYAGSGYDQDRFGDQRGRGRRDMQAGRLGGYASEDESVHGLNQQGAREFAQEQYGQGPRGQGGQSRFGDSPHGRSQYGQGGYGPSPYGQGYRQGGYAQGGDGREPYNERAYNERGYNQGAYNQRAYNEPAYSQRPYDQGEYNQSGYGRGDFAQVGFGHGGDPRLGHALGDYRGYGQGGYGHAGSSHAGYGRAGYDQGYAQGDEGWGNAGYGMGGPQGRQSQRGKGPRSYARSDERITEDLCERLMQDDDIDATNINISVSNGEVALEGTVEQRWMKHRIEDLADRCSGVKDVENRIRVKRSNDSESDRPASSSNATTNGGKSVSTKANPSTTGTTARTNS